MCLKRCWLYQGHLFLDEAMSSRAYEETALPMGLGKLYPEPWVVAKMTEWLFADHAQKPVQTVLEIGTGSGLSNGILALLAKQVFTVERIAPLSHRAQSLLTRLCLHNIKFEISNGHWGWPHPLSESPSSPSKNLFFQTKIPATPPVFDGIISDRFARRGSR